MRRSLSVVILCLCGSALIAACTPSDGSTTPTGQTTSSASSRISSATNTVASTASSVRATSNVAYEGIVQPAGISIYMEGSHRLSLSDGRFILLESNAVDLNGYVGEGVRVVGAIRPTVEADAMILRVDQINLLEEEDASSTESTESSLTSESEVSSSIVSVLSSAVASTPSSSSAAELSSAALQPIDPSMQSRIDVMAEQDVTPSNWTQQYCTAHIGFCIPVHKNWWFHSFGATTSNFWHVEISSEEIHNLGDGPITVKLIGTTIESVSATDGMVQVTNGRAVGYRSWSDGRHFEITADVSLESAVRHITENLVTYTED